MTYLRSKRCDECGSDYRPRGALQRLCPGCLELKGCECSHPIQWSDECGVRCVKCGKYIEIPKPEQLVGR